MFQNGDLIAATKNMQVTNYLPKGYSNVQEGDLFLIVEYKCDDLSAATGYSLYDIKTDSFSWWAVELSFERCFSKI